MKTDDFVRNFEELSIYLISRGVDMSSVSFPNSDASFPLFVSKYYVNRIDWNDPDDPLRKMVIPDQREFDVKSYELEDPIGDQFHSPVPGIVHRYPDRCLLMLTNACAVHCRFCFRKNLLGEQVSDLSASLEYIQQHPEIREVIFSGGDPFTFTPKFLDMVLEKLSAISHVKTVRFHTRTPAVYPAGIHEDFVRVLSSLSRGIVVLHVNHPREITPEFVACVDRLRVAGMMLLSQTVLLKGVNDDVETLKALFYGLVDAGVKPYYLHHLDKAVGTHHFRISLEEGKRLYRELRGNISGVCLPEYVLDVPDGFGKIPVFWFQKLDGGVYVATNFEGKQVLYQDPNL